MKVILLKDVKKLGRAHEELEIADGHALNYLIPHKFAVAATPAARKTAELHMRQKGARREIDAKLFEQNIASLVESRVVIKAKANEKGHLYNGIGAEEISAAAKETAQVDLPVDSIKLEKHIKELGIFDIPVSFGEAFGKFSITIEAE